MPEPLSPQAAARAVDRLGYCVLPSVFSPAECEDMARQLDAVWEARGRPALTGFGMGIHPLLAHAPDMAPFFAHPAVLAALREVLRDDPRLSHTGARLSDETSADSIGWHEHYAWPREQATRRDRPERVLFGCYVRGSSADTGPLVVWPRRVDEPIPSGGGGGGHADWPGQVAVEAPPGSVVIFDTALFHTAHRGRKPGRRYLWGAHCQGWHNPRPHPEDNTAASETLEAHQRRLPLLRAMLEGS